MKLLLLCAGLILALPLTSRAQFGILTGAVERAASRVVERKVEEALERKINEKTGDYYGELLKEGRIVSHAIQFEEGTATLMSESQPYVKGLADMLRRDQAIRLRIEAHTLLAGDAATNLRLSQRRAEAIRLALINQGIGGARLITKGLGSSQPMYAEPEDDYAPLNQRVEFVRL